MTYSEKKRTIIIKDIIKSDMCVTQTDGETVFMRVYEAFQANEEVTLSFSEIKFVISAFLNPALGLLYKYYDAEYLNRNLKLVEITRDQREMVKEVLRNAKKYWLDREAVQKNLQEAIDEGS